MALIGSCWVQASWVQPAWAVHSWADQVAAIGYFPGRYFPNGFFPGRYFPHGNGVTPPAVGAPVVAQVLALTGATSSLALVNAGSSQALPGVRVVLSRRG